MSEFKLTIPLEPPSGNHYKRPRVFAGTIGWYHTAAAKEWFRAVALLAGGGSIFGEEHHIEYTVFQGKGSRGDVDNYAKVILDGLVRASVIESDASVTELLCRKRRDRANPRTEIIVRRVA